MGMYIKKDIYAFNKFKSIKEHIPPPKKDETRKIINPPLFSLYRTKILKTNQMINTFLILG
jgi:hypothetical protein